ncbi:hypothetical protein RQP54_18030 [Curvibacter sp. APW13]|uniref:hypothetical protein n=1 Tax=Curvibacter sp. APW13 TaxID=3077236 RepID=UPI0028DDB021|nr:hypothetical protein [Curvibacter sp. APW13]MDT8992777.1 hypothetical protein [Curvibacter sp. APW13]
MKATNPNPWRVMTRMGASAQDCWHTDGDQAATFASEVLACTAVIDHVARSARAVAKGMMADAPGLQDFYLAHEDGTEIEVLSPAMPHASFKEYTYFNAAGGTTRVSASITATLYKAFHDDEIGWVFHGYPVSAQEQALLREGTNQAAVLLLTEHALLQNDAGALVLQLAQAAQVITTPDGFTFKRSGKGWSDGDITVNIDLAELQALGAEIDLLQGEVR